MDGPVVGYWILRAIFLGDGGCGGVVFIYQEKLISLTPLPPLRERTSFGTM